ncbi:MAG TPA: hypothetical protein VF526_07075, partial [Solirubrobacteraceae bacterium]
GEGADARELAHAAGADRSSDGPLVVSFEVFLGNLTRELSGQAAFRTRLAEVTSARAVRAADADERELAGWLVERFRYVQTAGIGTARHVQLRLDDVYVPARAVRERQASERWGTREEQQRVLLAERLRAGELTDEDYEAELDRVEAGHAAGSAGAAQPVAVLEALRNVDEALVLGEPGSGKTTLLQYVTLQHARALLDARAIVDGMLGRTRLPFTFGPESSLAIVIASAASVRSSRRICLTDWNVRSTRRGCVA